MLGTWKKESATSRSQYVDKTKSFLEKKKKKVKKKKKLGVTCSRYAKKQLFCSLVDCG